MMAAAELQPLRPHQSSADTVFVWDGLDFDLTVTWVDVTGVVWHWSGTRNRAGEPLMGSEQGGTLRSLPDLYRDMGPLIPQLPPAPLDFGFGGAA